MTIYNYVFSGYDWLGQIPKHWVLTKNRYGFRKIDNGFNQLDNTPVLSLTTKGIKVKTDLNFGKSSESYIGHQLVKKGDIVFTPRDFDQTPILSDVSDFDGCISNLYIVDKTKENVLNHYVNYYWYGLKYSCDYFKIFSHGMRYSFNRFQFDEIPLLIPPLSEQEQIVKFLDEKTTQIDSLISITEKKIELLKQKRTSLINEVVTKGLNPDVELKDSGVEWIGEIPKHWERTKMKHVVRIFGRIGYRGYTIEDIVNEGEGVITISPSNIKNDIFTIENENTYISYEKYYQSPEIMIFPNDILLVKTGSTIGKTSIIPENVPEMTINPQLIVLKEIKMFPKYLYYQTVCKYIKESFDIEQTGSTTPTISQEKINEFLVLNPPIEEQQQIVEYIDTHTTEIDKLVSIEHRRIETLKEYRQSLISEVVTGKVRVCDEVLEHQEN